MSARRQQGLLSRVWSTQKRQAREALCNVLQMRGLTPLLMKNRNGGAWTPEERAQLLVQLRALSRLSPYLIFLLLPGSALLLPLYAWWLDRRRFPLRQAPAAPAGDEEPTQQPESSPIPRPLSQGKG
jgi:hypothetical protein